MWGLKHNPKLDIFILLKQFKLGNILGITPVFFDTNCKKRIMISKVYPVVLTTVFMTSCVVTVTERREHLYRKQKITETIIDIGQCASQTIFVTVCLLGALTKSNNWKLLFIRIREIESKLNHTDFEVKKSLLLNNINMIIYHAMFLLLHIYESYDWITTGRPSAIYTYIICRIGLYYQLFELIFICKITRMLRRRYDYLLGILNETIIGNTLSCLTRTRLNWNLNDIFGLYKILYSIVQQFNAIFGWQIFFILQCTVLEVLNSINSVLSHAQTGELDISALVTNLVCSMVYIVSTVVIVMSCDGVEQSGKQIGKICFLHQEPLDKSSLKEELVLFTKITKELAPTFSAAGFFTINQSVLPTLFSTVSTYLIIIIQFNMTL
ncbi:gustatory receptor 68a-like [Anoplophora glabripennis]|nr:gustatory receptor 68a-like [Anoplophora glabripennis]